MMPSNWTSRLTAGWPRALRLRAQPPDAAVCEGDGRAGADAAAAAAKVSEDEGQMEAKQHSLSLSLHAQRKQHGRPRLARGLLVVVAQ